eukprot:1235954-Pleurochrysis_carterae.AAC.1
MEPYYGLTASAVTSPGQAGGMLLYYVPFAGLLPGGPKLRSKKRLIWSVIARERERGPHTAQFDLSKNDPP